jgi:GNAT superfamily N-acetyltransferase
MQWKKGRYINMNIVDFDRSHIEAAMKIALENYEEERRQVTILPEMVKVPDLTCFAENHLGVAALEGNRLIGYLCAYEPLRDVFGTTNVKGTFSPIHGHGNIGENRDRIYSYMYQAAAVKWVKEGIISHAIGLYAHDREAERSFFYNGFGLRCIDALRPMEEISPYGADRSGSDDSIRFIELPKQELGILLKLHNALIEHLGSSPIFMCFPPMDEEELYKRAGDDIRYFAAKKQEHYIAYVKVGKYGENFVTEDGNMQNICGAYCIPEYRGRGVYPGLISYMIKILKMEGYTRLGVDCESFNPNARGFWLKHFTGYTHSVVRRIDEKAVKS